MTFAWWHVLVALIPICCVLVFFYHFNVEELRSDQEQINIIRGNQIAVFLPVLGGLIYIFAGRKHAGEKL